MKIQQILSSDAFSYAKPAAEDKQIDDQFADFTI